MRQLLLLLCLFATPALADAKLNVRSYTVAPVITVDAYAQGDQMGTLTKLTNILPCSSCGIRIDTLTVVDRAKIKHAFDIYFFSSAVALTSVDNGAFDITDALAASSYLGKIVVAAADLADTTSNALAMLKPALVLRGATGGSDLWLLPVCTDSSGCDYDAVDGLSLHFTYSE